jgi:hypothetical protein
MNGKIFNRNEEREVADGMAKRWVAKIFHGREKGEGSGLRTVEGWVRGSCGEPNGAGSTKFGGPGLAGSGRGLAAGCLQITYLRDAHRLEETVPISTHLHSSTVIRG